MALPRRNRRSDFAESGPRRMLFWGGVALFSTYLLFFLVFGRMGLIAHLRLAEEAERVDNEISRTRGDIAMLTGEVEALTRNPHTVERLARERLGMVRDGDTVFLFEPGTAVPVDGKKSP
ncbi:MAG: septum formation initiator family protein [Nitrospirota bacterium]|nr:septum formation initiator family protein [Nitrospirota bacterium]